MAFIIRGKVKNEEDVVAALNTLPNFFFFEMRKWLKNERANVLGGKDSSGKVRKGYRDILRNKKRKRRSGAWDARIAGLFKGFIPKAKNIDRMKLTMGILGTGRHQLKRALEKLQTGGTITSSKQMPIPIYKNLKQRFNYTGPWSEGDVHGRMKSKAFRFFQSVHHMVAIKQSGKTLYFDPNSRRKRGQGYLKSGLLFIGLHGVRVRKSLAGRHDLIARFERMQGAMIGRGRTAVDRATKRVEKKLSG